MAILTVAVVSRAGLDVAGAAADVLGDEWANTGQEFVEVKNGSGAPITVTLNIQATVDGAAAVNPTITVNAGVTKIIGPFPKGIYNQVANGRGKITYSAVTSVLTKVFNCAPA